MQNLFAAKLQQNLQKIHRISLDVFFIKKFKCLFLICLFFLDTF